MLLQLLRKQPALKAVRVHSGSIKGKAAGQRAELTVAAAGASARQVSAPGQRAFQQHPSAERRTNPAHALLSRTRAVLSFADNNKKGLCALSVVGQTCYSLSLLGCATCVAPLLLLLQMKRSTVVAANGSSVLDNYRTSYGTFIKWGTKRSRWRVPSCVTQQASWLHCVPKTMPMMKLRINSCAACALLWLPHLRGRGVSGSMLLRGGEQPMTHVVLCCAVAAGARLILSLIPLSIG
jgi:hypothetical protein